MSQLSVLECPMRAEIAETLVELRQLSTPVVRSCHVGNNTANIWGWLALAGKARIVQVDHTLYGVDEVCIPWMVLRDGGRVEACYDFRGHARGDAAGRHLTQLLGEVPRKHRSYLAFGIFADHAGEDLISRHFHTARALSRAMNGSWASHDAAELLASRPHFEALFRSFHRDDLLGLLFDRWILPTRSGHFTLLKLRAIERRGPDELEVFGSDSRLLFRGPLDRLLDDFFAGMAWLQERLETGRPGGGRSERGYPWISGAFGYLAMASVEAAADPRQTVFWHGGGSTSQYYIHDPAFAEPFLRLRDRLAERGFLPTGARLRIVPTYCCQLFATSPEGLDVLEELMAGWLAMLSRRAVSSERTLELLERTTSPRPVVQGFLAELDGRETEELLGRLGMFNERDVQRLPIAHAIGHDDPHYNKYGVAQERLLGRTPLFPSRFGSLRWGEAELLVKVLAELTVKEPG
jgi:hypothetical protein